MKVHSPEQEAIAADLGRRLEAYAAGWRHLLRGGWDAESYRALCSEFDAIQLQVEALPGLSVGWTELLISRVELVHALWSLSTPSRINGRVLACHAQHELLVERLRRQCAGFLEQAPGPQP